MSNVEVGTRSLRGDLDRVIGMVRAGSAEVVLAESDRLVQEGLLVQNVPVTEERIAVAEEMMDRKDLFREGYGRPDTVQLPDRYERWGFTCTVSRKSDLATIFFFGTPVMVVVPDDWYWLQLIDKQNDEAVQNAADALENYGEFPVDEGRREGTEGYGICGLAELVATEWLR